MNICIIGSTGIIGSEILLELSCLPEVSLVGLSSSDLDLYFHLDKLEQVIVNLRPDIIINAVGFTDIDAIENNKNKGFFLNCLLPHCIAEICSQNTIKLIHFSSDNVFDGLKLLPYTEEDTFSPINYYGWTKAHTDKLLLSSFAESTTIFRISGIYSHMRKIFFTSFLKRIATNNILEVVVDIYISPTPANLIAKSIAQLISRNELLQMKGIYHLTARGGTSWFEFAKLIVDALNFSDKSVVPVSSEFYSTIAKRPKMNLMTSQKLEDSTSLNLPTWQESFRYFISLSHTQSLISSYL